MTPVLLAWTDALWAVLLQDDHGRCAGLIHLGEDLEVAQDAMRQAEAGIHTHLECQWTEIPCDCGFVEGAQPASDAAANSSRARRAVAESPESGSEEWGVGLGGDSPSVG